MVSLHYLSFQRSYRLVASSYVVADVQSAIRSRTPLQTKNSRPWGRYVYFRSNFQDVRDIVSKPDESVNTWFYDDTLIDFLYLLC